MIRRGAAPPSLPQGVPDPAPPTNGPKPPTPPPAPVNMTSVSMDFPFPYVEGRPIDTCVTMAGDGSCGKPAADIFCVFQRCEAAVSYVESTGERGPTYVQGDRKVREQGGNSFDLVTCTCLVPVAPPAEEDPASQIVYEDPKILGHPLDWCLSRKRNETCGKPSADAFCESFGSKESVRFEAWNGTVAEPTWLIGDHALNKDADRRTFKSITCV